MGYGNLRFAVLGLVATRSQGVHGYQLKSELEALCGDFWQVNYGSVYRVLDMLDKSGDLEALIQAQEGRPARRVYRITKSGKRTLDDWLLTPLAAEPKPLRDELALRLLFLTDSNVDLVGDHIKQQRTIYIGKLARITRWRRMLARSDIDADVTRLVMDGAEMRVKADLAWLDYVSRWMRREA